MQKLSFLSLLERFVLRHQLFTPGDSIIVAVSGGIDSMSLLEALRRLSNEWKLQLSIAHFNHKLRSQESDDDESFVHQTANRLGIPIFTESADTKKLAEESKRSIQDIARELRYNFFERVQRSTGSKRIATAHNADDNAETMLFNIIRGSGVKGLSGIPLRRNDTGIIRPFLFASRAQIADFAESCSLSHREDSSNKKTDYSRNFLRHDIIPRLKETINPNITATLNRSAELFTLLENHLEEETVKISSELIREQNDLHVLIDLQKFQSLHPFFRHFFLFEVTKKFSKHEPHEIDLGLIKEMLSIVEAETGSACTVSNDVTFFRDRDTLALTRKISNNQFSEHIVLNNDYQFQHFHFSSVSVPSASFSKESTIEYVDAERMGSSILLRNWKEGDWFIPLGMTNRKKISDFFIEQKVPIYEKSSIPILESDGEIVWICGYRLDNRYKIVPTTQKILKLEYKPKP